MSDSMRKATVASLILWVVLGQVGGFVDVGAAQNITWAISSMGMLVASPLLAIRFAREGKDLVAAGHILLTICALMLYAGGPISTPGGQVSFAASILFYAPALLLIGSTAGHPLVARVLGAVAAVAFAAFGFLVLAGVAPTPSEKMAVNAGGYLFMTTAVIGWIVGLVRLPRRSASASPVEVAA